jgi:membrane protein
MKRKRPHAGFSLPGISANHSTSFSFSSLVQLFKIAFSAWLSNGAPSMGAALSYYTIFSIAPLCAVLISVAGLVFGADAVRGELFGQLQNIIGIQMARRIQDLLVSVNQSHTSLAGTLAGVFMLIIGATSIFTELQHALDRIWRIQPPSGGLWRLIKNRIWAFSMIICIACLLGISLLISTLISILGTWWKSGLFDTWEIVAQSVHTLVSFLLTATVFALIYKVMPRAKVGWQDVGLGSLVTAALFTLGQFLISFYIGKTGIASGFGAAGSIIALLVWVYYSAQIFLFGAELTWVYAQRFGSMKKQSPS